MEDEKDCTGCKKKAALFTGLGVLAGAALGILIFKQVSKRGG